MSSMAFENEIILLLGSVTEKTKAEKGIYFLKLIGSPFNQLRANLNLLFWN